MAMCMVVAFRVDAPWLAAAGTCAARRCRRNDLMVPNPIRSRYCHAYNQFVVSARYKGVVDALAADIRAGKIPPGTRLPTHRELAARERLALVTATRVYAELAAMGLVSGEAGRGTFVRESTLSARDDIEKRAL